MRSVTVIMPVRGRPELTLRTAQRLRATASYNAEWFAVGALSDNATLTALRGMHWRVLVGQGDRLTYWQALQAATDATRTDVLCAVASDVIPGMNWLQRGMHAYDVDLPHGGLLGFNGDSHEYGHSCHFLIGREYLASLGGWPTWYDHNFGDTELCARAQRDRRYSKAPYALLFHDHPFFGGDDDAVYHEGRHQFERDRALFEQRRRQDWSHA